MLFCSMRILILKPVDYWRKHFVSLLVGCLLSFHVIHVMEGSSPVIPNLVYFWTLLSSILQMWNLVNSNDGSKIKETTSGSNSNGIKNVWIPIRQYVGLTVRSKRLLALPCTHVKSTPPRDVWMILNVCTVKMIEINEIKVLRLGPTLKKNCLCFK